jgi:hypothetical protein
MNILKLVALTILMTFGTATAQEVEKKMQIKVMVAGDGSDEASAVHWSSHDMDFDMQDLAVGETRTIESEAGKTVTIARAEEGFSIDVDGKTIMMPDLGAHGTHMAFVSEGAIHEAIDIDVDSDVRVMKVHRPEGVTIVSGKPLDQSVKDSIRSVLISAGNNEEITFIDGSQDGKRVMVKKIEVINQ